MWAQLWMVVGSISRSLDVINLPLSSMLCFREHKDPRQQRVTLVIAQVNRHLCKIIFHQHLRYHDDPVLALKNQIWEAFANPCQSSGSRTLLRANHRRRSWWKFFFFFYSLQHVRLFTGEL